MSWHRWFECLFTPGAVVSIAVVGIISVLSGRGDIGAELSVLCICLALAAYRSAKLAHTKGIQH